VATGLNNLATVLRDTNRLAEAELLMRRGLTILLRFAAATGHQHPNLDAGLGNWLSVLDAMGQSHDQMRAAMAAVQQEVARGG